MMACVLVCLDLCLLSMQSSNLIPHIYAGQAQLYLFQNQAPLQRPADSIVKALAAFKWAEFGVSLEVLGFCCQSRDAFSQSITGGHCVCSMNCLDTPALDLEKSVAAAACCLIRW